MNSKVVAPVALSVGLLGLVGGVAATQAFQPVAHPAVQVRLVQPAAQTITVTPSPTTTTPAPVKTTTAAPAAPKPAPVQSTQAVAPAPRIVQKAAVVSTDTSSSTPTLVSTTPASAPAKIAPPLRPAVDPGQPTAGGGVYGGGAPSPTKTN